MSSERSRIPRNVDYAIIPIDGYEVGSWCRLPDGQGRPEAVVLELHIPGTKAKIGMRFKSRRAAKELIDTLTFHMNDVWPTDG